MPFKIGPTELILVAIVLALLFGTKKLPALGSSMGKAIRDFRQGLSGADEEK